MSADLPAAIEALRRAQPGRDFLLVSASISRKLHRELSGLIAGGKQHAECTVFLCTMGGDSDAGFRIGRCLQQHYEHIRLAIPSYCKSAGTLIAIGAHELAIARRKSSKKYRSAALRADRPVASRRDTACDGNRH